MSDTLLTYLRASLPAEVARLAGTHLKHLEEGEYKTLLESEEARILLGQENDTELSSITPEDFKSWNDFVFHRLGAFCGNRTQPERQVILFCIGYAALLAFVQANVTGPPLEFQPSALVLPQTDGSGHDSRQKVRQQLLSSLTVDGIAPYKLTPHIELLCLADAVMTCPAVLKNVKAARWAKIRVAFLQQRLLSEVSSTLQNVIYDDIELLLEDFKTYSGDRANLEAEFLLERATIHTHHSLDKFARADLDQAKNDRKFEFALTGLMGKRTKFQQKDTSQLLVLAKSHLDTESATTAGAQSQTTAENGNEESTRPANLDLNDDTLLESISFTEKPSEAPLAEFKDREDLPPSLRELDPSDQPQLQPLDSIILLSLASSIKNTSPEDGLTREETLPYATRVLEGGSSNWQVYTQALLVRSRIEGYRSRTVERGLLQLQTLVDQVIADTATEGSSGEEGTEVSAPKTTSFLPKAKESESAPVAERIRYIFQLATPTRWELEAELATRWVQLGGLRSALEIYERLEMWAEAALCHAATEREDKAKRIVGRQLFYATNEGPDTPASEISDEEEWTGPAREPPPLDAPRLYCILGDIDQSIEMYEKAWEVSNERYARAQRSIGRHFIQAGNMVRAAEAYSRSLKVNQLNQQSWFALGCALLELAQFSKAVEAFSRCVQLDETDAESWSNLAAALLHTDPEDEAHPTESVKLDDEDEAVTSTTTAAERAQNIRIEALKALKRAASLKHDSFRIWENVLIVAASIRPEPDWTSILSAQKRIIDIRGPADGEKCIDIEIMTKLVNHIIATSDTYDPSQPGLTRMVVKFVDETVVPLITSSAELWHIVGKLALWRNKPSTALDAEEKAWRAVTSQPGWESDSEAKWNNVVDATVRLVDAYESLGQRERTEGMAAGSGELVAKDWKFKARTAIRGILGKGKDAWEDGTGWEKLKESMEGLRGCSLALHAGPI
ncbi:TPR repeat-containing protein [Fulvia fulva]|uniref:TPR repeat-containing protein n=1 Tax=Passalora fulva TaxID=5499 RepID=A0A9Q8LAH2_PASFU|nr:TPR repeat-containing protein [Fulvia fulva]KAK4630918.1 TPR repeat-containing protein [Fulvia fulva]KAK4632749.1 TPR repeat-containing protein [Fulvia fulva]UJO13689.1 TPR repeat-containing protein [Fulvia fulva]WPV10807.1 TPR repeat-containing protein [Fulvia fulva]WPV25651.1 TPR repeat-containing protein [Fulvia fulva]